MASEEDAAASDHGGEEVRAPSQNKTAKFRNRIKGLRWVRAGDLRPNPKNWRRHPQAQRDALLGLLEEIGFADVLLVVELADGSLMIVDGHLRADIDLMAKCQCLYST